MNHRNSLGVLAGVFIVLPALAVTTPKTKTATQIEHVIVIVGENWTFDNLFATYRPKKGQSISNLLSQGIVKEDGSPGPNFKLAEQHLGENFAEYSPTPNTNGAYAHLPQPYAWGAFGQRKDIPDASFPTDLPNGPFQLTKYVSYTTKHHDTFPKIVRQLAT
jgi:phospholipase C